MFQDTGMEGHRVGHRVTANVAGVCSVASLLLIFLMSNPPLSDVELPPMKCDDHVPAVKLQSVDDFPAVKLQSVDDVPAVKPHSELSFASMLRLPGVALLLFVKTVATLPGELVRFVFFFRVE